jgi:hypothetical protein
MSKEGIEPRTSHALGYHLSDCAIADVTRTTSFPNVKLHINSRKINGQNRSGIEYLNESNNVFKIDRSINSDYKTDVFNTYPILYVQTVQIAI